MEIKQIQVVGTAVYGLGVDNVMYIWNHEDAKWDLLAHE